MNFNFFLQGSGILFLALVAFVLYRIRLARLSAAMNAHFERLLMENTLPAQKRCEELLQRIEGSKAIAEHALSSDIDPERMRRALGEICDLLAQAIKR